jgi:hypothetical protein
MKCKSFFILLFLIPILIYGLGHSNCTEIYEKIAPDWKRHYELIEEFKKLGAQEQRTGIHLLNESLECCKRAVSHCDTILNDIAAKSGSDAAKPWRIQLKTACTQNKTNLNSEIDSLQTAIRNIQSGVAFEKANILFRESEKTTALANAKEKECPRRLNNVNEAVDALKEISRCTATDYCNTELRLNNFA